MFNSYVRKTNIIVNRNCKNSQQDTTDIHIYIQQRNKISADVNKWETMKSGSLMIELSLLYHKTSYKEAEKLKIFLWI